MGEFSVIVSKTDIPKGKATMTLVLSIKTGRMSFQYFPVCTVAEGKVRKDAECYSSSYHFA